MKPATHPGNRAPSTLSAARGRHVALLGGILAAHAALIAAVAITHSAIDRPAAAGSHFTTFDIARPTPRAAPARIVPPVRSTIPDLVPTPPPVALSLSPTFAADGNVLGDGGCDLTETLQAALRSDPLARAAVASLPTGSRSVANAVMLWDGHLWVTGGGAQAQGSLGIIRRVASEVVRSASPECRDQPQAGPRLIVMPGAPDVTLAIGSGRWRWGDLALEAGRQTGDPMRIAAIDPAATGSVEFNYRTPAAVASGAATGSYLNIAFMNNHILQGVSR